TTAAPTQFNRSSGHFNVSVGWGTYTLKIAAKGFVTYTSTILTVPPLAGIVVNPTLVGSWLNGSVGPVSGAVVEVNGTPVHLTGAGTLEKFSVALPGGIYVVTAHATGYSYYATRLTVAAGAVKSLTITLTNRAHIVGYVTPPSAQSKRATLLADQVAVPVAVNGSFNASVLAQGALINLTASLVGYVTVSEFVTVAAGNASWQNFTLNLTPTTCTGAHCGTSPTCPGSPSCPHTGTQGNAGIPSYVYAVLAAVVVAVGIAVLLLRRRRNVGRAAPESEESAGGPATDPASEVYGSEPVPKWDEPDPGNANPPDSA
ncbi:MAG: hypothetical protein L3J93_01195, partial [Thermoplasmata archaeon]|nr:hypothetical protein [Thermoplasmata archaeon]